MLWFILLIVATIPFQNVWAQGREPDCKKVYRMHGDIYPNNHDLLRATSTVADCLAKGDKRATLSITSTGGNMETSFDIHRKLSQNGELTTIGTGVVESGATLAFLAGKVRILMCDASILIHEPRYIMVMLPLTIDRLERLHSEVTGTRDHMAHIYANRTGMSIERAKDLMRSNKRLTAEEALAMGFATHVVGRCKTQ